jgi:hypothetical protein
MFADVKTVGEQSDTKPKWEDDDGVEEGEDDAALEVSDDLCGSEPPGPDAAQCRWWLD